jgi:hypothetical protein
MTEFSKDSGAYSGIITVSFLVLGKVETRPPGWPCNGARFIEHVRDLVEASAKGAAAPLLANILLSTDGLSNVKDEIMRLKQLPGPWLCTLIDQIDYRWEWKHDLWKLGKRVIRLDVVEDGMRENVFQHVELPGAYKGDQVFSVETSTIGASSDLGYLSEAHASHHATVADESLTSTGDQSFEADRGCTCSLM